MRNLILIGLAAFLFMLTAATSIIWWTRSLAVKKQAADIIESFNVQLKDKDSSLTYDSIEVSGFPVAMNVAIMRPHFIGRIDKLLADPKIKELLKITTLPEWSEDILIDGKIVLGVDALSNKFKLDIIGNSIDKSNIAGRAIDIVTQMDGGNACELQLKGAGGIFGDLWNFSSIVNDKKDAIKIFNSLNCITSGGKSINNNTKEELVKFGGGQLYVSRVPKNDISDIRFYLSLKDFEVSKAYDDLSAVYIQALNQKNAFHSRSSVGKVNIEIDLSYRGTEDWHNDNAKNLPLDIVINKFHINDNSYQADSNLHISNNVKDGIRNIVVAYKSETTATELFRTLLKGQLRAVADSAISGTTPATPEVQDKLKSLSSETMNGLIDSVVPDFVYLGKMVTVVDANYSGDENFTVVQANLPSFELSAVPYGITATGAVKRDKASPIPAGNLSLTCRNCLKMIDDGVSYFTRLTSAVAMIDPSKFVNVKVNQQTVQAIKDFLLALQVSPDNKTDLKFEIVSNGAAQSTVNGKSTAEVMKLFNQTSASVLQSK